VREYRLVTHAYKPALIPIITVIGLQIALCSAARCSPRRPSSGRARLPAGAYLKARDFVAVQGIVAMIAVIVAVTNFIVDIIAAIDPRVRY
jgi:peptide/nickel transport system permease protein